MQWNVCFNAQYVASSVSLSPLCLSLSLSFLELQSSRVLNDLLRPGTNLTICTSLQNIAKLMLRPWQEKWNIMNRNDATKCYPSLLLWPLYFVRVLSSGNIWKNLTVHRSAVLYVEKAVCRVAKTLSMLDILSASGVYICGYLAEWTACCKKIKKPSKDHKTASVRFRHRLSDA